MCWSKEINKYCMYFICKKNNKKPRNWNMFQWVLRYLLFVCVCLFVVEALWTHLQCIWEINSRLRLWSILIVNIYEILTKTVFLLNTLLWKALWLLLWMHHKSHIYYKLLLFLFKTSIIIWHYYTHHSVWAQIGKITRFNHSQLFLT